MYSKRAFTLVAAITRSSAAFCALRHRKRCMLATGVAAWHRWTAMELGVSLRPRGCVYYLFLLHPCRYGVYEYTSTVFSHSRLRGCGYLADISIGRRRSDRCSRRRRGVVPHGCVVTFAGMRACCGWASCFAPLGWGELAPLPCLAPGRNRPAPPLRICCV